LSYLAHANLFATLFSISGVVILKHTSLQRVFILPFVLLMLCLAATIGWVLYRAGEDATDVLSRKALTDMLRSVNAATERHMLSANTTLRAVAPEPVISANSAGRIVLPFPEDLSLLEDRFWVATGLFPEVTRYVYFGAEDGRFIGVNRVRQNAFELRLREKGDQLRRVYSMAGPREPIALLRAENMKPNCGPGMAGQRRAARRPGRRCIPISPRMNCY
jgi:hypothetical protein